MLQDLLDAAKQKTRSCKHCEFTFSVEGDSVERRLFLPLHLRRIRLI